MNNQITVEERQLILGALDTLATDLAGYNHIWSVGERAIFEEAVKLLGAKTIWKTAEGEEWKES